MAKRNKKGDEVTNDFFASAVKKWRVSDEMYLRGCLINKLNMTKRNKWNIKGKDDFFLFYVKATSSRLPLPLPFHKKNNTTIPPIKRKYRKEGWVKGKGGQFRDMKPLLQQAKGEGKISVILTRHRKKKKIDNLGHLERPM